MSDKQLGKGNKTPTSAAAVATAAVVAVGVVGMGGGVEMKPAVPVLDSLMRDMGQEDGPDGSGIARATQVNNNRNGNIYMSYSVKKRPGFNFAELGLRFSRRKTIDSVCAQRRQHLRMPSYNCGSSSVMNFSISVREVDSMG